MVALDPSAKAYIGTAAVDRMYLGTALVWRKIAPDGSTSWRTTDWAVATDLARIAAATASDADTAASVDAETVVTTGIIDDRDVTGPAVETWFGYVNVADADTVATAENESGGSSDRNPTDADVVATAETEGVVAVGIADADTANSTESQATVTAGGQVIERTPARIEASTGTTLTATLTGSQAADLAVAIGTGLGAVSISSGWQPLVSPITFGASNGFGVWYRVLTGGAADNPTLTHATDGPGSLLVGIYDDIDPSVWFDTAVVSNLEGAAATSMAITGPSTVTNNALVITGAAIDATSSTATLTPPSGYPQDVQTTGTGRRAALASAVKGTPGAVGTLTWTQAGPALSMVGFAIALRPVPTAANVFDTDILTTVEAEALTSAGKFDADTAASADADARTATQPVQADTATTVETEAITVPVPDAEVATSAETETRAATLADADTAVTVEGDTVAASGPTPPQVSNVSPAMVSSSGASTLTSASFTAPANSVIVMCVHSDGAMDHSASNSGTALAWALIGQQKRASTGTGSAAAFVAPCPTSRTLTVTWTGSFADDVAMKVYVITAADLTTPIGAKRQGAATTNVLTTGSIVTQLSGSLGFVVADEFSDVGTTTAPTLTAFFNYDVAGRVAGGSGYKRLGSAGSAETFSLDAAGTATADWNYVCFEVRGAGG
jgi:hypothetical protein